MTPSAAIPTIRPRLMKPWSSLLIMMLAPAKLIDLLRQVGRLHAVAQEVLLEGLRDVFRAGRVLEPEPVALGGDGLLQDRLEGLLGRHDLAAVDRQLIEHPDHVELAPPRRCRAR